MACHYGLPPAPNSTTRTHLPLFCPLSGVWLPFWQEAQWYGGVSQEISIPTRFSQNIIFWAPLKGHKVAMCISWLKHSDKMFSLIRRQYIMKMSQHLTSCYAFDVGANRLNFHFIFQTTLCCELGLELYSSLRLEGWLICNLHKCYVECNWAETKCKGCLQAAWKDP